MKLNKDQIMVAVSTFLFLLGGVFCLVNVFGGISWAIWVGLPMIAIAAGIVLVGHMNFLKREKAATEPDATTEGQ